MVRAYIEHGMHNLPGNQKLYYVGPMFRRERPQKGRYRQFYQIGAEVLGPSDAPAIDAEVIEMLLVLFNRVGLTRTTLYVNSIGCKECRPKYVELLREELRKVKDRLGADSQRRIETNPLRVLDSKLPEEQEIIATLPRISDHLCEACREHFAKLKDELKLRGIAYEENWRLVRGLDYYTRTTFEVTAEGLGSQNAVCGGGRYDGLVELLGGPPTKGIGFAIGTDRAILSIQESGNLPKLPGLDVFVARMGEKCYPAAVTIARKLRDAGFAVRIAGRRDEIQEVAGAGGQAGREVCADHWRGRSRIGHIRAEAAGGRAAEQIFGKRIAGTLGIDARTENCAFMARASRSERNLRPRARRRVNRRGISLGRFGSGVLRRG